MTFAHSATLVPLLQKGRRQLAAGSYPVRIRNTGPFPEHKWPRATSRRPALHRGGGSLPPVPLGRRQPAGGAIEGSAFGAVPYTGSAPCGPKKPAETNSAGSFKMGCANAIPAYCTGVRINPWVSPLMIP